VYCRRQPTFIADHIIELPTPPSSIVVEIDNVWAIILIKQDDNDTDQEIRQNKNENLQESTLSSDIEEDHFDNQQEVLHVVLARGY
jgi:hypothetical protein